MFQLLAPLPRLLILLSVWAVACAAPPTSKPPTADAAAGHGVRGGGTSSADGGAHSRADGTSADGDADRGTDGGADRAADASVPMTSYSQSPARCGLSAYTWLPPSSVGAVVSWNEHELTNLSAVGLKALLNNAGLSIPLDGLKYGVRNFRLRYSTQDKGKKTEATAIVSVPTGLAKPADPATAPAMLWLHGTSGWSDACAPSGDLGGVAMAAVLAGYGYVVIAPDYLGMLGFGPASPKGTVHPYLIGEATALASLDAVRAAAVAMAGAASLTQPDVQRLLLIGASEGGHGVLATERFLPHYAPELRAVAGAALVPPADLTGSAKQAVQQLSGQAKLFAAMWASMSLWYQASAPLDEILRDDPPVSLAANLTEWMATTCDVDAKIKPLQTIDAVYQPGFISAIGANALADPWACLLRENSATTTAVPRLRDVPLLMVYGEDDDLVPPKTEAANFQTLCKQGYRLRWRNCKGEGHAAAAVKSLPFAMQWLADRVAEQPLDAATLCQVQAAVVCQ